jgi:hypothetical protein
MIKRRKIRRKNVKQMSYDADADKDSDKDAETVIMHPIIKRKRRRTNFNKKSFDADEGNEKEDTDVDDDDVADETIKEQSIGEKRLDEIDIPTFCDEYEIEKNQEIHSDMENLYRQSLSNSMQNSKLEGKVVNRVINALAEVKSICIIPNLTIQQTIKKELEKFLISLNEQLVSLQ